MPDAPPPPAARDDESPRARTDAAEPRPLRRRPNRAVAFVRGWTEEHVSREKFTGAFQTMLWVVPLTILIWIYAERQQQVQLKGVTLPVRVVSGDPSKVVRLEGDGNVVATLIGPPSNVDRDAIRAKFDPQNNRPIEIVLDRTTGLGRQSIQAIRIRDDKRFTDAGITVDVVSPVELVVVVDQIVTKSFPVQLPADQAQAVGNVRPPVFDPPTVEVTGPGRLLSDPMTGIRVEADVASVLGKRLTGDREIPLTDVPLALVGVAAEYAPYVKLMRTKVNARVVPVEVKEETLRSVRLWLAAPKQLREEFLIDFPENLANVTVSGPRDAIDKLTSSQEDPVAYVRIPPNVIAAGQGPVPIEPQLPDGVVWTDPRKTVDVNIRRR
ncbi:MAG: hypothetical protein JWO31_3568 [Phycisphaerales bacterium]|nr:hypothetical protein [Phycisphaerales bacterium]